MKRGFPSNVVHVILCSLFQPCEVQLWGLIFAMGFTLQRVCSSRRLFCVVFWFQSVAYIARPLRISGSLPHTHTHTRADQFAFMKKDMEWSLLKKMPNFSFFIRVAWRDWSVTQRSHSMLSRLCYAKPKKKSLCFEKKAEKWKKFMERGVPQNAPTGEMEQKVRSLSAKSSSRRLFIQETCHELKHLSHCVSV